MLRDDRSNENQKQAKEDLNYIKYSLHMQEIMNTEEFNRDDPYIKTFMKKHSKGVKNQLILKSYRPFLWARLIGD